MPPTIPKKPMRSSVRSHANQEPEADAPFTAQLQTMNKPSAVSTPLSHALHLHFRPAANPPRVTERKVKLRNKPPPGSHSVTRPAVVSTAAPAKRVMPTTTHPCKRAPGSMGKRPPLFPFPARTLTTP